MIRINLLPPEELKGIQFRQRKLPIVPSLFIVFLILFMYWLMLVIPIAHINGRIYYTVRELKKITPKKSEVDVVWDEIHNNLLVQKEYLETVIVPPIEWAHVLNIISNYTSQGVWLYRLHLEEKDNRWLLTLGGFAKPVTARSMIKDIGNYVTNVKDAIELSIHTKAGQARDLKGMIEVSTTTKRKQAYNIELTEFTATMDINI